MSKTAFWVGTGFGVIAAICGVIAGPDIQHSGSGGRFLAGIIGGLSFLCALFAFVISLVAKLVGLGIKASKKEKDEIRMQARQENR